MNVKSSRRTFLCGLASLLALAPLLTLGEPKEKPVEPVIGTWRWMDKQLVDCKADGTFSAKPTNRKGTWKVVESKTEEAKYEFTWDEGLFVDTMVISKDKQSLKGKNKDGKKISATKTAG